MAQYAGICKEGDTNKGLTAAARDATTINALKVVGILLENVCFYSRDWTPYWCTSVYIGVHLCILVYIGVRLCTSMYICVHWCTILLKMKKTKKLRSYQFPFSC